MILSIRAIPKSSRKLIKEENGVYKAYLTKPAHDGEANSQLIELLSVHLNISKSRIRIIRGQKARHKEVEIDG